MTSPATNVVDPESVNGLSILAFLRKRHLEFDENATRMLRLIEQGEHHLCTKRLAHGEVVAPSFSPQATLLTVRATIGNSAGYGAEPHVGEGIPESCFIDLIWLEPKVPA